MGGLALLDGVVVDMMGVVVGADFDDLARAVETYYVDVFMHEFFAYSIRHLSAGLLDWWQTCFLFLFFLFLYMKYCKKQPNQTKIKTKTRGG